MHDLDIYTVRYWIGPATLEDNKYYKEYKAFLASINDLLPLYTIENEFGDLWLYCVCPIRVEVKRLMERWYCGMFQHVTYKEFEN